MIRGKTPSDLLDDFGSVKRMSEMTGIPKQTIYNWRFRNCIPLSSWKTVVRYAWSLNIKLSYKDLVEAHMFRKSA